ncbi:MAG: AraC family ligand binding domain-containing protein, partial [Burkholderiales bacterium]
MSAHNSRRKPRLKAPPELVRYQPPRRGGLGVETLSLAQLRQRGSARHLAAMQRPEFLMFVLYTRGNGEHVVDFVRHRVVPNTLIVVRAGDLHQFRLNDSLDARLLVVDPKFMLPERLAYLRLLLWSSPWPACSLLPGPVTDELLEICDALERDGGRPASRDLQEALARQRLYTWLISLRIAWDASATGRKEPSVFSSLVREFQVLLDEHYPKRWTVQDYARKLGYAERTLTRACLAFSGKTAKAMNDARVLL